jgi:hypothetical protein
MNLHITIVVAQIFLIEFRMDVHNTIMPPTKIVEINWLSKYIPNELMVLKVLLLQNPINDQF